MKYDSLIFDLGGVLLHWNPIEVAQNLHQQDPAFPPSLAQVCLTPQWKLFDKGDITQKELVSAFSSQFAVDHLELFIFEVLKSLQPISQGLALLEYAQKKGFSTFILSNLSREFHDDLQRRHPFMQSVSGSVFSCHIHSLKPAEEIYTHLLHKYQIDPAKAFFIDDLEINIQGGKRVGIDGIVCQSHALVMEKIKTFSTKKSPSFLSLPDNR